MEAAAIAILLVFAMLYGTIAKDPDMLQDLCVVDTNSGIKVNGFTCKPVAEVKAEDFFSDGLAKPGNTNNWFGAIVTAVNVQMIPGLNTLGLSMARIDYAPGGLNPPHIHPRAIDMVFVLEGELYAGFITTANVLISKTIKKGENFVFPRGLVHFQINNRKVPAAVIVAFSGQLPGTQQVAVTLFNSTPPVPNNILAKAFQIGSREVDLIKSKMSRA